MHAENIVPISKVLARTSLEAEDFDQVCVCRFFEQPNSETEGTRPYYHRVVIHMPLERLPMARL